MCNDGQTDVVSHLDLEEDVGDLLHLGELVVQLGVVSTRQLLTHQLVRLQSEALTLLYVQVNSKYDK